MSLRVVCGPRKQGREGLLLIPAAAQTTLAQIVETFIAGHVEPDQGALRATRLAVLTSHRHLQ